MATSPKVLIVDASCDSAEVLAAVLNRRGVDTLSARRAGVGLELARTCEPDVIVLDAESLAEENLGTDDFADPSAFPAAHLVLIGKVSRNSHVESKAEVLAKPYQYPALVHKIESLLADSRAA